jgi:small subunit ribosomal protein S3
MGQKIHPNAIRLGVNKPWKANWFAKKGEFAENLRKDTEIRDFLFEKLRAAGLDSVVIKRYSNRLELHIHVARPGVVIGRGGSGIEQVKKSLMQKYGTNIELKVYEVKRPEVSASLIADNIVNQLERRIVPKFICQRVIESAKATNAIKGIRIWVSGRIKGAEIARTEKFQWGTVPLQTIRANVEYAYLTAQVPNAGKHGIKVWIYTGEKFSYDLND